MSIFWFNLIVSKKIRKDKGKYELCSTYDGSVLFFAICRLRVFKTKNKLKSPFSKKVNSCLVANEPTFLSKVMILYYPTDFNP